MSGVHNGSGERFSYLILFCRNRHRLAWSLTILTHLFSIPFKEPYGTRPPRTPTQTTFAHEDLYDDKLPATLEFLETGEDAFFATVVSEVNGQAVHFKLAPTYTLYMCSRYRMSPAYRPELMNHQRGERLGVTLLKIANMARSTIRVRILLIYRLDPSISNF